VELNIERELLSEEKRTEGKRTYKASVLETCCDFRGKSGRDVRMSSCGGGLVV
jgi:hypothetical protein